MFSGNVNKNSPKLAKFILCSEKARENNSSNIITVNLRSISKLRNICIAFTFAKVLFAYDSIEQDVMKTKNISRS